MIINRGMLEEALEQQEKQIEETGDTFYLQTLRCFESLGGRVQSTKHFCECCSYYERVCKQYLAKFEIKDGAEID